MIESPANDKVRYLRSLQERRHRQEERSFVAEGVRLLEAAAAAEVRPQLVLYEPGRLASTPRGEALLRRLDDDWRTIAFTASERALRAATATVNPQGIVAAFAIPGAGEPLPGLPLLVIADGLQDPGNLGTLLRSAEAAGATLLATSHGTVDAFNPKVVRAAMGTHFTLPLRPDADWPELERLSRDLPLRALAVASSGDAYYTVDWTGPAGLIVCSEASGASPEAAALATRVVSVPMRPTVESLNAAVAGSVILFEAGRQRAHAPARPGTGGQ